MYEYADMFGNNELFKRIKKMHKFMIRLYNKY